MKCYYELFSESYDSSSMSLKKVSSYEKKSNQNDSKTIQSQKLDLSNISNGQDALVNRDNEVVQYIGAIDSWMKEEIKF